MSSVGVISVRAELVVKMRSGGVRVLVLRVLPGRSVSVRVGGSSRRTKDLLLVSASAVPKGNEAQTLDKTRERPGPFTLASSCLHTL